MPKNHNTHSSREAQPDKLELSNNMSREELLEYYDNQLDRIVLLNEALGYPEDEWTNENGYFESGAALRDLVSTIYDDETYTPVHDDILVAQYVDAAIEEKTAFYSIDGQALLNHYENYENITDLDAAVLRYTGDVANDLKGHNVKIANKIKNNVKPDPENPENLLPLDNKDLERLGNNKRANFGIIGDVGALKRVDEVLEEGMTVKTFIELRNRYAAGEVSEADMNQARKELDENTDTLGRAADAYLLIVGDKKHNFKMKDFVDWLDLEEDQRRAHTIAKQQGIRENAAKDIDATLVPQTKAQRKASQRGTTTPTPNSMPSSVSQPGSSPQPSPHGAGATSGSTVTPPVSTGGTPPPTPNSAPAPTAAQLEGQKNLVKNARARLAESGRRRSTLWGGNYEKDAADAYLHQEFGDQVYKLMELTNRELIDNPDGMNNEQWGSLIAAHATASYDNVLNDSTEGLFDPEVKEKKSERVAKVAARLGVLGVAGFIGGPAGVALAGGVMAGLKVGKGYEKNGRKHLKSAIKEHRAEAAVLEYVNNLADDEAFDPREAFEAARKSLSGQFEKEYVEKRRKRIMGAIAVGAAAGFASQVLIGQVFAAIPWVGDNIYQEVSKLSWSGTGVPWDGGLNPNFNYTMHARPFSLDALSSTFDFTR